MAFIPSHSSSVLNSLRSFNPMGIVRAQDASSSDSPCSYNVFLSFRGEDTRKTFTDHLYTALNHRGFHTFRAIQESRISIVVFSKNYASSSWCLDELVMILKRRRTTGHVVLPVFYHMDPSHVRKQMESFEEAFTRHEERFHTEGAEKKDEWKGKIQEWRAALKEATDLAGMNLQNQVDGFEQDSERVVQYCGGLPLAIKVLGSSLSGKSLNVWKSQLEKLKAIPDYEVVEKLKISYDSLPDEHDKNLFLHVACFFVGMDEDWVVTILDGCDFYTTVGIQNLIDRCLLAVDERKKLVMHQLVQEMGREIVRQESPKELGERSRLWNHKDSFNVLRENTGTGKIEGLKLDMNFLEDKYDRTTVGTAPRNSDKIALEVDAFARMHKLKLLQLKNLQVNGSFENFPKGLRWLCWHGFSFNFICDDFPLDNLVVLDMQYSNLQKFLKSLKILDLSCSNIKELPLDIGTMDSLRKLNANEIAFEIMGELKLEPIGNIDVEIMNNLGLPNFGSMGSPTVTLSSTYLDNSRKLPLQGFLIWSHSPQAFGIPEVDEDMMWLSYWKFENQLKDGDELVISVVGNGDFQVKEVGVHLVHKEQEEKSSQSTSEEAFQLQFSPYGNVVPGKASTVHPVRKKVFRLGSHWVDCSICDSL
ncbi:unnamed protein product [Camellia sinensis]